MWMCNLAGAVILHFHQKKKDLERRFVSLQSGRQEETPSTNPQWITICKMGFIGLLINKLKCSFVGEMKV